MGEFEDKESRRHELNELIESELKSIPKDDPELEKILKEYGEERQTGERYVREPRKEDIDLSGEPFIDELEPFIDELLPGRGGSTLKERRNTARKPQKKTAPAVEPKKYPEEPEFDEEPKKYPEEPEFDEEPKKYPEEPEFDEEPKKYPEEPEFDEKPVKAPKKSPKKKNKTPVRQSKPNHGAADYASGVIETPEPEFEEDDAEKSVFPEEPEEEDVRDTISELVTEVMSHKKRRNRRILHKPSGAPVLRRSESRKSGKVRFPVDNERVIDGLTLPKAAAAVGRFLLAVLRVLGGLFFPEEDSAKTAYSDDLKAFRRLKPEAAIKRAKKALRYYRWRMWAVLLLTLAAGYITTAPTLGLPLSDTISYVESPFIYLFLLTAIQIGAMLLSVAYLADGLRMVVRKRWKTEFLVLMAGIVNLLYTFRVMTAPQSGGYLPYHMPVLLMLFFGMMSRTMRYSNVLRFCRAMTAPDGEYRTLRAVRLEDGTSAVCKGDAEGLEWRLVDKLWEEDPSERLMRRYVPFILLLTLIFAVTAAVGGSGKAGFLWCWSALLSVSLPGGLALTAVLPIAAVSGRLAAAGVVFGGCRSAEALADAETVVLRESDLFRSENISVDDLTAVGEYRAEKVNLYSLSVLRESGSVLYDALAATLARVPLNLPPADQFAFYENGGMGAFVNANRVMIGSYTFLARSGVTIPGDVLRNTGIYVAINMQFAGYYPVKYTVQTPVRRALSELVRCKLQLTPAVRDFNLTEKTLQTRFNLPENRLSIPSVTERVTLSETGRESQEEPLAALSQDSITDYADTVAAGKRIARAVHFNLWLGLVSAFFGVVLVFLLLFAREAAAVTPYLLFFYGVFSFLPVLVLSIGAKRR